MVNFLYGLTDSGQKGPLGSIAMALDYSTAQSYQTCAVILVGVHPVIQGFEGW